MAPLPPLFDPRAVEEQSRSFWAGRALNPPSGPFGPSRGALVHQLLGTVPSGEGPISLVQRTVVADAQERYLALSGRRSLTTVAIGPPDPEGGASGADLAEQLGVRSGVFRASGAPSETPTLARTILDRLASRGLLESSTVPLQTCLRCRLPRSPESIVYQEEDGAGLLIRFPIAGTEPRVSALVWTDAAWKLLGTSAVLLHPDRSYSRVRFQRRGLDEQLLVVKEAVPRLRAWLPESAIEVLEEKPGRTWTSAPYIHPLSVEYPAVAQLPAPAGTLVADAAVTEERTGIVAVVPSHGAVDAGIAGRLNLPGWPVVGSDGTLDRSLTHKYAGLPIDVAEAFILRDLTDAGSLFAEVRGGRGVPRCVACGGALVWIPGRTWTLMLGKMPAALRDQFARMLPGERLPDGLGAVPWPVAQTSADGSDADPALLECPSCPRLAPTDETGDCPCGGRGRRPVRRRLLPGFCESVAMWEGHYPFPSGDGIQLFVPERRRVPFTVLFLVGVEGTGARPGEVRLIRLPTLHAPRRPPPDAAPVPQDAVRATVLRADRSARLSETVPNRHRQETRRLRRIWLLSGRLLASEGADAAVRDPTAITSRLSDLLPEDRAFLSVFERLRIDVLRLYADGQLAKAERRLMAFVEDDLFDGYLRLADARLAPTAPATERALSHRVLLHVLPLWVELYAPIAPFTMEALHRAFHGDGQSIFEQRITDVQESLVDPNAEKRFRRWVRLRDGIDAARSAAGYPRGGPLGAATIVVSAEELREELIAEGETIGRTSHVAKVEVASPAHPWEGRQIRATPVLAEIQKAYHAQAGRIAHVLAQLAGSKIREGLRTKTLSVALEGRSLPITASMVELSETLPDDVVPVPFTFGEVLVPRATPPDGAAPAPWLSPDGLRLLRSLDGQLRRARLAGPADRAVVEAPADLREELARNLTAAERFLELSTLRIVTEPDRFAPPPTRTGRTARGQRWALWVPGGVGPAPRQKRPPPRSAPPRVRIREGTVAGSPSEVDFGSESVIDRNSRIREMVERLDSALGAPLVGPAKLSKAWDAGLQSYEALTEARFDTLSALPGFGPELAGRIVATFGHTAPPRSVRHRPSVNVRPHRTVGRLTSAEPTSGPEPLRPDPPPPVEAGSDARPSDATGTGIQDPSPVGSPEDVPDAPLTIDRSAPSAPTEGTPAELPSDEVEQPPISELVEAVVPPAATASDPAPPSDSAREPPPSIESIPATSPMANEPAEIRAAAAVGSESTPEEPHGVSERSIPEPRAVAIEGAPTSEGPPAEPAQGRPATPEVGPSATPEIPLAEESVASSERQLAAPATTSVTGPPEPPVVQSEHAEPSVMEPPPAPVEVLPESAAPEPTPSGITLWLSADSDQAWAEFLDVTTSGSRGLCLTRDFPERVRALLGDRTVQVLWMSNAGRDRAIPPTDLARIEASLLAAVREGGVRAIYLGGVEYLLSLHPPELLLASLEALNEASTAVGARVWVPIDESLVDRSRLERLQATFPTVTTV